MRIIKTLRQFPELKESNSILYYFFVNKVYKLSIFNKVKTSTSWYCKIESENKICFAFMTNYALKENRLVKFDTQQEANEFISEFKKLKHNKQ